MTPDKLAAFKKDLKKILHKHNVVIGVDPGDDADTHGIDPNFVVIDRDDDSQYTLCHYQWFIDAYDLGD